MSVRHLHFKEFFRKLHQKKGARLAIYALWNILFPFVGFYSHFIEPRRVKVSHVPIPIRNLPKVFHQFRIVQISDIHFGPTNLCVSFLKKCVERINHLKPDLIALTGDFMQWDSHYAKPLADLLSRLKARFGKFAILGNHDYGVCHAGHPPSDPVDHREVIARFVEKGITVLHNQTAIIDEGEDRMRIVGLGDFWTEHFKPEAAFSSLKKTGGHGEPVEPSSPTILLSHNPDSIHELSRYPFDLMLSGHAHGGQISFPFIGPLAVPIKERHLRRGLHRLYERWLYVNRGLGSIFKARLLSRPEITCLELVPST